LSTVGIPRRRTWLVEIKAGRMKRLALQRPQVQLHRALESQPRDVRLELQEFEPFLARLFRGQASRIGFFLLRRAVLFDEGPVVERFRLHPAISDPVGKFLVHANVLRISAKHSARFVCAGGAANSSLPRIARRRRT
jgi:hypothetical protein